MSVTHSLVDSVYHISIHGTLLGMASKSEDGFTLEWATFAEVPQTFKTMKALKEELGSDLPDYVTRPVPTMRRMSVREACKKAGYSNNGVNYACSRIKDLWPHLPGHLYGERIFRLAMEYLSEQDYGDYGRKWLRENPTVGAYDPLKRIEREIELGWREPEDHPDFEDLALPVAEFNLNYEEASFLAYF